MLAGKASPECEALAMLGELKQMFLQLKGDMTRYRTASDGIGDRLAGCREALRRIREAETADAIGAEGVRTTTAAALGQVIPPPLRGDALGSGSGSGSGTGSFTGGIHRKPTLPAIEIIPATPAQPAVGGLAAAWRPAGEAASASGDSAAAGETAPPPPGAGVLPQSRAAAAQHGGVPRAAEGVAPVTRIDSLGLMDAACDEDTRPGFGRGLPSTDSLRYSPSVGTLTTPGHSPPLDPLDLQVSELLAQGVWKSKADPQGRTYYYKRSDKSNRVWNLKKHLAAGGS